MVNRGKEFRALKRGLRQKVLGGLSAVFLGVVGTLAVSRSWNAEDVTYSHGRALGATFEVNKTQDCPEDPLYAIPYLLIILYMFFALAIVCDDYFEPVLSTISGKLGLSEDVAGATFMAVGSSAPELLTSLSDTLNTQNSIGIGTIVGSAMFNVLIIVALSSAVTKGTIKLDWRPLARDSVFYIFSILILYLLMINNEVTVVSYDGSRLQEFDNATHLAKIANSSVPFNIQPNKFGEITIAEGALMLVVYVLYIVFMIFNQRIFAKCAPVDEEEETVFFVPEDKRHSIKRGIESFDEDPEKQERRQSGVEVFHVPKSKRHSIKRAIESFDEAVQNDSEGTTTETMTAHNGEDNKNKSDDSSSDDGDEFSHPLAWPDNTLGQVWYVITFPISFLYYITIPNTELKRWENWYHVSFLINIGWIGAACLLMVDLATKVGCLLEIDPVVMGIVLLAAGTSVPDAIASMIVARQGFADMAIANALGSNVFDILIGLGLPWVLYNAIFQLPVFTNNSGIAVGVMILLGTVILFLITIAANKCNMNSRLGIAFVVFYAVYIAYNVIDSKCYIPAISLNCGTDEE